MTNCVLFDGVSSGALEKLKKTLDPHPRHLVAGEILIEEGETTNVFWLLVSGGLQGARCYRDGSIDLVQFYSGGDIVCLDVVCTRTRRSLLQISCVRHAEVIAIDYDLLTGPSVKGAARAAVASNIVRLLADESMRKQYKIDVLYKRSMRARIKTFLSHMADKTGETALDVGMDRAHLAQYLGVNRSALSHELSLMQSEGLISFSKSRFQLLPGFYTTQGEAGEGGGD